MVQTLRRAHTAAIVAAVMVAALLAETGAASPIVAQSSSSSFFRGSDAAFLGGALAAALVISRVDQRLATRLSSIGANNGWYHEIATVGQNVGGVSPIALSVGMFAAGHLVHHSKLAALGKWGIEAVAISGSATWLIKGVAGRARPYAAAGDVYSFKLGRGFGKDKYSSIPSGHTSGAFALATVLARGTADQSPRTHYIVSGIAYSTATIIGLSRLYANQHWPSDLVIGAAIGITSGVAVVRAAHVVHSSSAGSSLAYFASHTSIAPAPGGGLTLAFSAR